MYEYYQNKRSFYRNRTPKRNNSPTFTCQEFQDFLKSSATKHLTGAPYNSEIKGPTESAVKIAKYSVVKGS